MSAYSHKPKETWDRLLLPYILTVCITSTDRNGKTSKRRMRVPGPLIARRGLAILYYRPLITGFYVMGLNPECQPYKEEMPLFTPGAQAQDAQAAQAQDPQTPEPLSTPVVRPGLPPALAGDALCPPRPGYLRLSGRWGGNDHRTVGPLTRSK